MLDKEMPLWYYNPCSAGLAHLVERHLAKVEVASSSLVARSIKKDIQSDVLFSCLSHGKKFLKYGNFFADGSVIRPGREKTTHKSSKQEQ